MKKILLSLLIICAAFGCFAQPPQFQMPENTATFKDINYAGDDKEAHRLDIYLPDSPQNKFKTIVLIYGSAWFSNNFKVIAYQSLGKALVDAGFAVVSINHQSSSEAKFPAQIHDVKAAIRFIRANADKYRLDTSFIGITGFSSGGHLSSFMGVTNGLKQATSGTTTIEIEGSTGGNLEYSSRVDAVVDWFGPVDMSRMEKCQTVKDDKSPEAALLGFAPADREDLVKLLSPINYVNSLCPKFLVIHGESDDVVPNCQSKYFAEKLKQAGVLEEFVSVPGGGHGPNTFNEQTFKKMTDFFKKESAPKTRIIENGGSGEFKAVMTEESSLAAHTIFRPQNLNSFSAQKPLPVLVWGNGACSNSPFEHKNFLNEIASHGYLVIATGYIPMTDDWYKGKMSSPQQQIEALDWAFRVNEDKNSPYYQKLDLKHICLSGMSCGGLQSLFNCADKRISALMICNSGLFNDQNAVSAVPGMPMPKKDKLNDIHTPIIYILGGKPDIAYENGMDDFHRIKHVPAIAINLPVGHGGTYLQPNGGEFSVAALAWLDWQLKNNVQASKMFLGKKPGILNRKDWTIEKNAKVK